MTATLTHISVGFSVEVEDAVDGERDLEVVVELEEAAFDGDLHRVANVAVATSRFKVIFKSVLGFICERCEARKTIKQGLSNQQWVYCACDRKDEQKRLDVWLRNFAIRFKIGMRLGKLSGRMDYRKVFGVRPRIVPFAQES